MWKFRMRDTWWLWAAPIRVFSTGQTIPAANWPPCPRSLPPACAVEVGSGCFPPHCLRAYPAFCLCCVQIFLRAFFPLPSPRTAWDSWKPNRGLILLVSTCLVRFFFVISAKIFSPADISENRSEKQGLQTHELLHMTQNCIKLKISFIIYKEKSFWMIAVATNLECACFGFHGGVSGFFVCWFFLKPKIRREGYFS